MPKTATPRPLTEAEKRQRYARLTEQAKREREASMSPLARMLGFGDAERGLVRDTASAANDVAGRGVMASLIGLPGDLAGMGENGLRGLLGMPQVQPWGGSEHIGQTMQDYGLVSSERRPKTELLASLISPSAAVKTAVNAPKTAMNLLRMADNWDAPRTMARYGERGAIDFGGGKVKTLYRGLERQFDPNYRLSATDAPQGYSTWTDNPELARQYAGQNGYVYKIDLPESYEGRELIDADGERALFINNQKPAGLNGVSGNEYLLYQYHDEFSPDLIRQFQAPQPGLLGRMVAPQDEALRIAQQNAAKPVSEGGLGLRPDNTPEERAAAMGFDTDAYHGSASSIEEIDPSEFGSATGAHSAKLAFWSTDDPNTAVSYAHYAAMQAPVKRLIDMADAAEAKGQWDRYDRLIEQAEALENEIASQRLRGQTVYPLMVRQDKPLVYDAQGAEYTDIEGGITDLLRKAKSKRKTGLTIENMSDDPGFNGRPATHYASFDPRNIRSRFAAFDPMRRDSSDILAGLAPIGLGGYWYGQQEP